MHYKQVDTGDPLAKSSASQFPYRAHRRAAKLLATLPAAAFASDSQTGSTHKACVASSNRAPAMARAAHQRHTACPPPPPPAWSAAYTPHPARRYGLAHLAARSPRYSPGLQAAIPGSSQAAARQVGAQRWVEEGRNGAGRLGVGLLVLGPLVVVVRSSARDQCPFQVRSSVARGCDPVQLYRLHRLKPCPASPHPHSNRHASKLCNPKPAPQPKYALCRVCRTTPSKKSMLHAVSQQEQCNNLG
jgi:hypothetical protein